MTNAFVTLVTNADYAMGATALARSIRRTGTEADIVVLHTGGVERTALAPLEALGCRLVEVEHLPLSEAFNERHARKNLHGAAPSPRAANRISTRRSIISASFGSGSSPTTKPASSSTPTRWC